MKCFNLYIKENVNLILDLLKDFSKEKQIEFNISTSWFRRS